MNKANSEMTRETVLVKKEGMKAEIATGGGARRASTALVCRTMSCAPSIASHWPKAGQKLGGLFVNSCAGTAAAHDVLTKSTGILKR